MYLAHELNKRELITGRKHALIEKYPLNRWVHLLARLYGRVYIVWKEGWTARCNGLWVNGKRACVILFATKKI